MMFTSLLSIYRLEAMNLNAAIALLGFLTSGPSDQ